MGNWKINNNNNNNNNNSTQPQLCMQVLEGFHKKSTKMSDTGDKPDVTPTGWTKHTYDIRLLYGLPEV